MGKKKENKRLRKENESLKREIERLRESNETKDNTIAVVMSKYENALDRQMSAEAAVLQFEKAYLEMSNLASSLLNQVKVSGVEMKDGKTTIKWEDGEETSAVCSKNDKPDMNIGIMVCFMKRLFGSEYKSVFRMWTTSESDKELMEVYLNLDNKNPFERRKAQKKWEKVHVKKRQSIRDRLKWIVSNGSNGNSSMEKALDVCDHCDGSCKDCMCK